MKEDTTSELEIARKYLQGLRKSKENATLAVLLAFNTLLSQEEVDDKDIELIAENLGKEEIFTGLFSPSILLGYKDELDKFSKLVKDKGIENNVIKSSAGLLDSWKDDPKFLGAAFKELPDNIDLQNYIIEYLERNIAIKDLEQKLALLNNYSKKLDETGEKHHYIVSQIRELNAQHNALVEAEKERLLLEESENLPKIDEFVKTVIEKDPESKILINLYKQQKFGLVADLMGVSLLVSHDSDVEAKIGEASEEDKEAWEFIKRLKALRTSNLGGALEIMNFSDIIEIHDIIHDKKASAKFFKLYCLNAPNREGVARVRAAIEILAPPDRERHEKISAILRGLDVYDLYEILSHFNEKKVIEHDLEEFIERLVIAEEPRLIRYSAARGGIAAGGVGALSLVAIAIYCLTNHTEFAKKFMAVIFNVLAFPNITEAVREAIMTAMPDVSKDLATAIAQSVGILPAVLLATGVTFALVSGITYSVEKFSSEKREFLTKEVELFMKKEEEKSKEEIVIEL